MPVFRRGQYDLAVLAALREVEDRVRHESGLTNDGVPLMRKAFGERGPLRDHTIDPAEANARADLFAGAFGIIETPSGTHPSTMR